MPGELFRDEKGQLALMDAMVFFSIAMLVSSILMAQSESVSTSTHSELDWPGVEVSDMLEVMMGASIGTEMTICLDREWEICGSESVAECLCAELCAVSKGFEMSAFDPVNEAIAGILEVLSGPLFRAHVLAVHPQGSSAEPVLAVPGPCRAGDSVHSSSMELPCGHGLTFTIILALEPAALPELM
ncbi:MAG: hypothetical protein JW880_05405 [Candidatus Thermoplasmatota archaeon]|nr:hypothetical protein [Candidatus Thermoplasmatota archaeon]